MSNDKFVAGDLFPSISLNTLNHGNVEIGKPTGDKDWQMVVVYRGKHCPMCTNYMRQLEQLKDRFYDIGIHIIAVSADPETKALAHNQEMGLSFPVAYGLSIEQMKQFYEDQSKKV